MRLPTKEVFVLIFTASLFGCATTENLGSSLAETSTPEKISQYIDRGWTVSAPLTIKEIEKAAMEERHEYAKQPNARNDVPMVPFGFINDKWQEFKGKIQDGDEIRKISSPPESWERLAGWEGYVLIRKGNIVWDMMTGIN